MSTTYDGATTEEQFDHILSIHGNVVVTEHYISVMTTDVWCGYDIQNISRGYTKYHTYRDDNTILHTYHDDCSIYHTYRDNVTIYPMYRVEYSLYHMCRADYNIYYTYRVDYIIYHLYRVD